MSFKEILETLPTIDHLTGLNVMDDYPQHSSHTR